ncbi:MAG: hypothetical protein WDW36_009823 [Sanguina aurantia]
MVRVIREMAGFVHCRPQDLAFLSNATTALNVVIRSAGLRPGDTIYMLSIGYGSVKKMAQAAVEGLNVVYGDVQFPISGPQDILDLVASTLPANTRLAVFDAVTSNTALLLPMEGLIEICKSRGVPVMVDAAHALGQIPVDLASLSPDYWVTNCHKWFAGPPLKPLVVSHGSGSGFTSDFIWDGCRDYAPYLAVSSSLRMWTALGPDRVLRHMHDTLRQAVALLTRRFGSSTLAPLSMCAAMALVRLPGRLAGLLGGAEGRAGSEEAKYVQDLLHEVHHVECPVKAVQGQLYVRVSCHIYNCLQDYETLADAVDSILHELERQQLVQLHPVVLV